MGRLTDSESCILDRLLPDRGERGPAVPDKRRTVNGIPWVLRTEASWRDMSERCGNWGSVLIRLSRWSKLGVCDAAFKTLANLRLEEHATSPRLCGASAAAAGVKGGIKIRKRPSVRGDFSTKIHLRTNADPLTFDVTPGEAHKFNGYDKLMELYDRGPNRMLGDKGYDSGQVRDDLTDRGIEPVIPSRSNRKTIMNYDREAYKRRNLIERCGNQLKQFRRIVTRYEKTARAFLSMRFIVS